MRTHRAAPCCSLGELPIGTRTARARKHIAACVSSQTRLFFRCVLDTANSQTTANRFLPTCKPPAVRILPAGGATCAQALPPGSHGCRRQRGSGVGHGERRIHAPRAVCWAAAAPSPLRARPPRGPVPSPDQLHPRRRHWNLHVNSCCGQLSIPTSLCTQCSCLSLCRPAAGGGRRRGVLGGRLCGVLREHGHSQGCGSLAGLCGGGNDVSSPRMMHRLLTSAGLSRPACSQLCSAV